MQPAGALPAGAIACMPSRPTCGSLWAQTQSLIESNLHHKHPEVAWTPKLLTCKMGLHKLSRQLESGGQRGSNWPMSQQDSYPCIVPPRDRDTCGQLRPCSPSSQRSKECQPLSLPLLTGPAWPGAALPPLCCWRAWRALRTPA